MSHHGTTMLAKCIFTIECCVLHSRFYRNDCFRTLIYLYYKVLFAMAQEIRNLITVSHATK